MAKIRADMLVEDVTERHPSTIKVFLRHGLHCVGCPISRHHTIGQCAQENGLDPDSLLTDLNKVAAEADHD